ncbi:MAG: DUF4258 domain-containing protein [Syntrophales bacterium]|jgi:hypothetical protein|nr:DUF4258 domain-containing protein [Syntrophales bacterium]
MEALSEEELKKIILEIFDHGSVIPSKHARERMRERGYSMADVRNILKHGALKKIEFIMNSHCYHLYGEDLEGHPGAVVTALISNLKIVIVTVMGGVK